MREKRSYSIRITSNVLPLSLSLSLSLSVESDGRDIKKLIQSCGTTLMRYAGGVHLITACPTVTRYGRKRVSPVAFQPVEPISFYVIVAVVVGVLLWSLVRRRPKCSRRPPLFLFIYFLFFSFVFFLAVRTGDGGFCVAATGAVGDTHVHTPKRRFLSNANVVDHQAFHPHSATCSGNGGVEEEEG